MEAIRHRSLDELEPQHSQNGRFEYERKEFLSKHDHANMVAGVYTIPHGARKCSTSSADRAYCAAQRGSAP